MITAKAMSSKNQNSVFWAKNKEWYIMDKVHKRFELTDKAPEEARRSFEEYKSINSKRYKN